MPYNFIVQLIIWVAITILTELLRPKPDLEDAKAATFDEFGIPTTDPKRAIPIVWGRVRSVSPGIIWYGDYRTIAIVKEVRTGLWSKDDFIAGYRYFIGVMLGIARSLDTYERLEWDEEDLITFSPEISPGDNGTLVSVDEPDFNGGAEGPGAGGGVIGDFRFFKGGITQNTSAYLSLFQDPLPAYKHLAYLLLEGVEVGTQPAIKPPAIICARIPNQLGLAAADAVINQAANPACVVFELMTDDDFGLNIPQTDINLDNFRKIGRQLKNETHGYSNIWVQKAAVKDIIDDILRQIDAVMFLDFESGQFEMRLVRGFDETSPEGQTLVTLDETNIVELEDFTRGNYTETSNRVVVNWKDPDIAGNPSPAVQDDMANQRIQNRNVIATFNYVGIDNNVLAGQVAARELRGLSFPLAKTSLVCDRTAIRLRPGDPFELVWPDLDIVSMNMRVLSISIGDSVELRVRVDAIQDIFSLGKVVYQPPQATRWFNPAVAPPVAALANACFEVPLLLDRLSPVTSPLVADTEQQSRIALLPVPNQDNVISWRMMQSALASASPADADEVVADWAQMCPSGLLNPPIAVGDFLNPSSPDTITIGSTSIIRTLRAATAADIVDLLANLFRIDDEFFSFETSTINGDGTVTLNNIHRAKLDTVPEAHSVNKRVFFMGLDAQFAGGITDDRHTAAGVVAARPNTTRGLLAASSASTCSFTPTNRVFAPAPPKNFKIGISTASPVVPATFFPTALSGLFDWDLTWDTRDRRASEDPDVDVSTSQAMEPATETVLQILRGFFVKVLVREVVFGPGSPAESFTYTVALQDTDFGGPGSPGESPAQDFVSIKIFSRRTDGTFSPELQSQFWFINNIIRSVA